MRAAALLLSLVAMAAARQSVGPMDRLRDWIQAVDRHRAGESDDALDAVCAWTDADIERMRAFLETFVGAPKNSEARRRRQSNLGRGEVSAIRKEAELRMGVDPAGFARRATMLHTDVALICPPPARTNVQPEANRTQRKEAARRNSERRIDVMSFDAQYQNLELNNLHWEVAMDMIDALPATPPDAFIAKWYATIGAHFLWARRFADALVHFDRARRLVPDSPEVLYYEARVHETLSGPRMQNFVRVTRLENGAYIAGIESERAELRRAETLLARALAGSPTMVGARLRLGRVMMRQQRWEEGLGEVQRVATGATDDRDRYLAHLFAGDAELALGRGDASKQSYERALALFPDAQAPRLGLANVIRTHGEAADAIAALLPTLIKPPERRLDDDPFWEYYESSSDDVAALIDELRAPFTGARR